MSSCSLYKVLTTQSGMAMPILSQGCQTSNNFKGLQTFNGLKSVQQIGKKPKSPAQNPPSSGETTILFSRKPTSSHTSSQQSRDQGSTLHNMTSFRPKQSSKPTCISSVVQSQVSTIHKRNPKIHTHPPPLPVQEQALQTTISKLVDQASLQRRIDNR